MGKKYTFYGNSMSTNFSGSPNIIDFVAYSRAMRNRWGNPCISHIMKYTKGLVTNGKKHSHYEKSMDTNFPHFLYLLDFATFSYAMWNWWGNQCIFHVGKYTIGWESHGKKAPMLWESMCTNFRGSSIRWVVLLYFPVLRKIERKIHAFSIWWDLLIFSCVSKSKLNSIENIVSEELIDSDINHDEFTLVINKVYHYFRLNKNIRIKDDQLGDIERDRF